VLAAAVAAIGGLAVTPAFAASRIATPTSLTIKAAHSTVAPKAKDTLTGLLKSGNTPLAGKTVSLMRRAAGGKTFTLVSNKVTDSKGRVVLTAVPGTKKGHEQYELVYKGGKAGAITYKASHSQIITISVT
jgi:5-hydroxyisourate hydrolase-like protein (transthyretin family)